MKFFPTPLIRQLDQYTIEHEPIASVELMERAAEALYREIISSFPELQSLCVLAGQGNNGGDALALARMMLNTGYDVSVFLVHTNRLSPDCEKNKARLLAEYPHALTEITEVFVEPTTSSETILVDGIFGSGLSRPTEGIFAQAIEWINRSKCRVVSIDIPSGLQGEENSATAGFPIVKASLTLSLQFPKLAFLLPENEAFVGRWKVLGIGIHPRAIEETPSNLYFTEKEDTTHLLKKRLKFSHKGRHGHGCIISGSRGMGGASVLASKAALRSGAGLVTVHGPECNRVIVQTAV
ncbi:MAG TPA: NAD(P)H-hydrate epimerase, partial [Paludibacter sp.]|nr:NAD(P)H-hydrate epimerase [Paludibacter sp.]